MDDFFNFDHHKNSASGKWNRLAPLASTDPCYLRVERKFSRGWKHPHKPKPQVHAIFKILSTSESLIKYEQYRARVAAAPNVSNSRHPGNEKLLFHGTNRCCLLAEDNSSVRLCSLPECRLCCVMRNSFDLRRCGTKHKFRRFGTGIYTTSCSSKADDYSFSTAKNSHFRVMLVNRVVVGKPCKLRLNATNLTEPPCGHHSIIGEPGRDLNYPETVVYDNDAIRPAFLVVYGDALSKEDHKLRALISTWFKTPVAS